MPRRAERGRGHRQAVTVVLGPVSAADAPPDDESFASKLIRTVDRIEAPRDAARRKQLSVVKDVSDRAGSAGVAGPIARRLYREHDEPAAGYDERQAGQLHERIGA